MNNVTFKFENVTDANATVKLLTDEFAGVATWNLEGTTLCTKFNNDIHFGQFIFFLDKRAALNNLKYTWSEET